MADLSGSIKDVLCRLMPPLISEFGILGAFSYMVGLLEQRAVEAGGADTALVLDAVERHRANGRAGGAEASAAKMIAAELT